MAKQVLFLDVDGVLLDWFTPFLQHVTDKRSPHAPIKSIGSYGFHKHPVYKGDESEFYHDIETFVNTKAWATLSILGRNSFYSLSYLRNMGIDLHCLTQTTASASIRMKRVENLTRAFGPTFNSINFTSHGEKKSSVVLNIMKEQYADDAECYMVEDDPDKMDDMLEHGIPCFGIKHDYNVEYQGEDNSVQWLQDVTELPLIFAHSKY